MNEIAPSKRPVVRSRLATWLCLAALLAATGCETVRSASPAVPLPAVPARRRTVDLSPLMEAPIDLSHGLSHLFPDYEPLVTGGVQLSNRRERQDGVIELVQETYDWELAEANTWVIDVSLTLFATPARAARDLDSSCYSHAQAGGIQWREGLYCISPVLHLRNDPQNLHLPTNTYFSWVIARRDGLVLRLYERHKGSSKSAKNRIIGEIAQRLSGSEAAASEE